MKSLIIAASVGDDYRGPLRTPAAGNQMTIALELKLLPAGSEQQVGRAAPAR